MRSAIAVVLAICSQFAIGQEKTRDGQVTVSGSVVDEEGRPVAGVAIGLYEPWLRQLPAEVVSKPLATTAADGSFRASVPVWSEQMGVMLWLVAAGRVQVLYPPEPEPVSITLPKARSLAGRVVDAAGKPLRSVRVLAVDGLVCAEFLIVQGGAIPFTAAVTDDAGRFVMPGTCAEAMLLTLAEPELAATIGPIAAGDPIELVARPLTPLTVTACDRGGRPVPGAIITCNRSATGCPAWLLASRTAEDGMARIAADRDSWLFATRCQGEDTWEGDAKAPAVENSIRLLVTSSKGPWPEGTRVDVRATDAAGKPVREFRTALLDVPEARIRLETDAAWLRSFAAISTAAVDGVAHAPWWAHPESGHSHVVVAAPGFALSRSMAPTGQDIVVKLELAIPITGVVVDQKTEAPLRGARVWSMPDADFTAASRADLPAERFDPGFGEIVTGSDGSFTLEHAGSGAHVILCRVPDGGRSAPVRVTLEPGKSPKPLRLIVPPLQSVVVKTGLAPPPRGARVEFRPLNVDVNGGTLEGALRASLSLRDDGSATVPALPPGTYHVALVLPWRFRQRGFESFQLATATIGLDARPVDLDGRQVIPSVVRGRVKSSMPGGRLLVLSIRKELDMERLWYAGPVALLTSDGSYELQEPPGERRLVVVDMVTGVLLHQGDLQPVRPGRERTVDLAVSAHPVEIRFDNLGAAAGQRHFLDLRPEGRFWPEGLDPDTDGPCGMGLALVATDPVRVWLPDCSVKVSLFRAHPATGKHDLIDSQPVEADHKVSRPVVLNFGRDR